MEIDKKHRKNDVIYNNALQIIESKYQGEMVLLPTIITCSLHDGVMCALQKSGMLDSMVCHGGTSLQRIYGSDRLSEDLDFCMRKDITELTKFKGFCRDFEVVPKDALPQSYEIDAADIILRNPKNDMSIIQDGHVFTWKIGVIISLGEKQQIVKMI